MRSSASTRLQDTAAFELEDDCDSEDTVRLLIVDDDAAFRRLCREYLRHQSEVIYEIHETGSAEEAVAAYNSNAIDCVLIDYRLPDASGTGLIRRLKLEDEFIAPMIMLTAVGSEDIAIEAVHSGAADYIPKHQVSDKSLHRAITYAVERNGLRSSIRDRTEKLQQANEQLRRKNDQIQRFYHTVSHEIKTPLTAAREFIALVVDEVMGDISEQQAETLNYAIQSCDQIATHFNDLIESTRLETGKLRIDKEHEEVHRLVEMSVMSTRSLIDEKGIALKVAIAENLPAVHVDCSRIVQVLTNLLGNAVKYTDEGGTIEVSAYIDTTPNHLVIRVRDSGCGIPPEHLPRVFERLYQVDERSHASSHAGLGLGLSIAQEIVGLHDGRLEVESELGKGSIFRVILPIG